MKSATLIVALVIFLIVIGGGIYYLKRATTNQPQPSMHTVNSVSSSTNSANNQTTAQLPLTINSPSDNAQTTNSSITVQGSTIPNATVHVNEDTVQSDANGNFSINSSINPGANSINIYVYDNKGNYAQKEVTVTDQNY